MPRMPSTIKHSLIAAAAALATAAVIQQLRRLPDDRTWNGTVLGVPYDFRMPTASRIRERWWNPSDKRLFTPHAFGVGWSINLYRLTHRSA